MITIGIKNPPAEASFWMAIFYLNEEPWDIETDGYLPIWTSWGVPGIGNNNADLSIWLFDTSYIFIEQRATGFFDWIDNTNYLYNWDTMEIEVAGEGATGKKPPWLLFAGGGLLAVGAILVASRSK